MTMDLLDVYNGRQRWPEYIRAQAAIEALQQPPDSQSGNSLSSFGQPRGTSLNFPLSSPDYALAVEAGLGAIGQDLGRLKEQGSRSLVRSFDLGVGDLAEGLDGIKADFNLLLGDLMWRLEMSRETLDDILREIRLAEFERAARAYRSRAERAYRNGWYEEAVADFLEAEKLNYPDFAVLRSIASIHLYHVIDLPKALEYFRKAAKYSRPSDTRQSAEANYFAGIVCVIEHRLQEAATHFDEAVMANPDLCQAHYERAWLAALMNDAARAAGSLEAAIKGDPRYHERAKNDRVFEEIRPQVDALLDSMMRPVADKLAEARQDLKPKPGYVIARSEEAKVSELFRQIEERMAEAKTYKGGLEFLDALSRFQAELTNIYDLFHKQHQIDLNDYVRSVAFSPDGRLLASGFLSGGLKLWDVYSGLNALCLEGHSASVNSVAFSPNSRWLASASRDKTIKLWDADSGGEIQTLRGHESEVRSAAFSPDGGWLVSGSHDQTVRMWRVETGSPVQILGKHKHHVTSVVFSPNGRVVASASQDKTVKLWDVASGCIMKTLKGHTRGVESLAFSPDGKLIASGGDDRKIKIWDSSGRELQTLTGLTNDVTSLAFSPDAKLLAAGSLGKTIKVWRLAQGELIKTLRFTEISYNPVAFSPEGQWLALGTGDIQLWLKVVLTEDEYAAVKAGKERAMLAEHRSVVSSK